MGNNLPPMKAKGIVHEQIAKTAKGLAQEQWAQLAVQNAFYKRWPKPDRFVEKNWPKYVNMARQILIGMLGSPKYDAEMKGKIHEALMLDGVINPKEMAEPEKVRHFLGPSR